MFTAIMTNRPENAFLMVDTGKLCVALAPRGAVNQDVQTIPSSAGKYTNPAKPSVSEKWLLPELI